MQRYFGGGTVTLPRRLDTRAGAVDLRECQGVVAALAVDWRRRQSTATPGHGALAASPYLRDEIKKNTKRRDAATNFSK